MENTCSVDFSKPSLMRFSEKTHTDKKNSFSFQIRLLVWDRIDVSLKCETLSTCYSPSPPNNSIVSIMKEILSQSLMFLRPAMWAVDNTHVEICHGRREVVTVRRLGWRVHMFKSCLIKIDSFVIVLGSYFSNAVFHCFLMNESARKSDASNFLMN